MRRKTIVCIDGRVSICFKVAPPPTTTLHNRTTSRSENWSKALYAGLVVLFRRYFENQCKEGVFCLSPSPPPAQQQHENTLRINPRGLATSGASRGSATYTVIGSDVSFAIFCLLRRALVCAKRRHRSASAIAITEVGDDAVRYVRWPLCVPSQCGKVPPIREMPR